MLFIYKHTNNIVFYTILYTQSVRSSYIYFYIFNNFLPKTQPMGKYARANTYTRKQSVEFANYTLVINKKYRKYIKYRKYYKN